MEALAIGVMAALGLVALGVGLFGLETPSSGLSQDLVRKEVKRV